MSILVLQSSWWGRESWLLCLICLPGVSWWLSGSSSRCHGVVCGLWMLYFLNILTYYFIKDSQPYSSFGLGLYTFVWATMKENLSSGFPTKWDSNQSPHLQRVARKLTYHLASLDMILSKERRTKALIRLRGFADWSAPLLFASPRRQVFSRRGTFGSVYGTYCLGQWTDWKYQSTAKIAMIKSIL